MHIENMVCIMPINLTTVLLLHSFTADSCCKTQTRDSQNLDDHLTEKPWSNMWTEFKGGQKAGRVWDEGADWYGSWELGGGRMTAPSYTPSVGTLRVWVPGEKLCCLVTFCSSGFTSSVRPLRSRCRSEKKRFIPVTLKFTNPTSASALFLDPASCLQN